MEDNTTIDTSCLLGPRTLGDFIRDTITIYNKYFFKMILILAITNTPDLILTLIKVNNIFGYSDKVINLTNIIIRLLSHVSTFILPSLSAGLFCCLLIGHLLYREVSIYKAITLVFKKVKVLIGSSLLSLFLFSICMVTVIGIPVAIYFIISWSFVSQIAIIESYSIKQILTRSRDLVKGYWWPIFGVYLFSILIMIFITYYFYNVNFWIPRIIYILIWPPIFILYPLIYIHIRVQKEQYTIENLEEEFSALEALADE